MLDRGRIVSNSLGLIGGAAGGVFGYVLFQWLLRQGLYGLILPGGMLGLGCGLLARHESRARGIVCGLAAVLIGLFTEFSFFKFNADPSFGYFLTHLGSLKPVTLLMIAVGGLVAYSLGKSAGFGRPIAAEISEKQERT